MWTLHCPASRVDGAVVSRSHKSILDYLQTNGFTETLNAFKAEAKQEDFQPDGKAKWSGLLEKKWTSVIRLQKKVLVLPRSALSVGVLTGPRRADYGP